MSPRANKAQTAPRRSPKQARSKAKVEGIVAAARRLLETEGAEALNTNRVAKEAGVGIGSLYEYFPNKQAIIEALIEELAAEESAAIMARFGELAGDDSAGDDSLGNSIDAIVSLTFELYQNNWEVYRSLWAMSSVQREVGSRPGERLILGEVERLLAPHAERLGIRDLALTCFTLFHVVESLASRLATPQAEAWSIAERKAEMSAVVRRYLGIP